VNKMPLLVEGRGADARASAQKANHLAIVLRGRRALSFVPPA